MKRRLRTPDAKFYRTNRSSPMRQTKSAGSNLVRGMSSMKLTPILEAARRSSSRKNVRAPFSSRKPIQEVRRTLQFEEKTPNVLKVKETKQRTPAWLGFGDRFQRYLFRKRVAEMGIPSPCSEGQWHAARMYDDMRNGHSYVINQWVAYLKAKGVLVHENFEGQLKFDPIPIRVATLLATGIDSVRVIEDVTKDSRRNTDLLRCALCSIASESSRLTKRLNQDKCEMKRGRRDAVVSVPIGIVSPSSRRRRRHHSNPLDTEQANHRSQVYSFRQSCDCMLTLVDGVLTSTSYDAS